MSNRKKSRTLSRRIAFCSMTTALSAALMLLGGLIPIATYCTPLLAGLLLLPILDEYGAKSAWLVWLATLLLTLILGADKEAAFFYGFVGWYPIVKPFFDRIPIKAVRLMSKAALFAADIAVLYAILYFVLRLETVMADLNEAGAVLNAVFFAVLLLCLLLYDLILRGMLLRYRTQLRPKLRFLK